MNWQTCMKCVKIQIMNKDELTEYMDKLIALYNRLKLELERKEKEFCDQFGL